MPTLFISHSSEDREWASRLERRLQEQGYASLFLDFDPKHGIPAGADWEQELYAQLRLCDALIFILSKSSANSNWCFAEAVLARSTGKPVFPCLVKGEADHSLLKGVQIIDFRSDEEEAFKRLWWGLKDAGLDPTDAFDWDSRRSPYPGLDHFDAKDAAVYFGRKDDIAELLNSVRMTINQGASRFIAVIGPSGSGKSSLVRAGLIPRLQRLSHQWFVLPAMRPYDDPADQLIESLVYAHRELEEDPDTDRLKRQILEEPGDLSQALSDLRRNMHDRSLRILLFIDQFEEIVTQTTATQGEQFLKLLHDALVDPKSRLVTIVTLRSEFVTPVLKESNLSNLVQETVLLGSIERSRLPEIIEGPSKRAGLEFETGLVGRMVEDTRGGDALPLLAYTLEQLYHRGGGDGLLTMQEYEALGGVSGALQHRAETTFQMVSGQYGEETVLQALLELVTIDAKNEPMRRRVPRRKLSEIQNQCLQPFVEARLLKADEVGGMAVVEVAHEALIREWPKLEETISQNIEGLKLQRQLSSTAADWQADDHDEGYLYRGARLAAVEEWLEGGDGILDEPDRSFVKECREARSKRQDDRRRQQRRKWLLAGLAIIVPIIIAVAIFIDSQRRDLQTANINLDSQRRDLQLANIDLATAEAEANAGEANALIAQSTSEAGATVVARALEEEATARGEAEVARATAVAAQAEAERLNRYITALQQADRSGVTEDQEKALSLAWSAVRTTCPADSIILESAYIALYRSLTSRFMAAASMDEASDSANFIGFDPTGTRFVTSHEFTKAQQWDLVSAQPVGEPIAENLNGSSSAIFSPDGRRIVTTGKFDGLVQLWDANSGKLINDLRGHDVFVLSAQFSPDGRRLLTVGGDEVSLWNGETGQQVGGIFKIKELSDSELLSPDGQRFVTASKGGAVQLRDSESGKEIAVLKSDDDEVVTVTFSPDSLTLVTAGSQGTIQLWSARDGSELNKKLGGHEDGVWRAVFSPDNQRLVTTSRSDQGSLTILWDLDSSREIAQLEGPRTMPSHIVFSPDGQTVATAVEKRIYLWDGETGEAKGEMERTFGDVSAIVFDPSSSLILASGHWNNTAYLWDIETGDLLDRFIMPSGSLQAKFSPDGKQIVGVGEGIRIWQVKPLELAVLTSPEGQVSQASFCPTGERLAAAHDDGSVSLWNSVDGAFLGELEKHPKQVLSTSFSSDCAWLLTASADKKARVWDIASGDLLLETVELSETGGIRLASFVGDSDRVITLGHDGIVILHDVVSNQMVDRIPGPPAPFRIALSPTGEKLITAQEFGPAHVYDLVAGEVSPLDEVDQRRVTSISFSPDGQRFATMGPNSPMMIWDSVTGKPIKPLYSESGIYSNLSFSPNGRMLAAGFEGGYIMMWDIESGHLDRKFIGPWTASIRFDPSGDKLLGLGNMPEGYLWDVNSGEWLSFLPHDGDQVLSASFNHDGSRIVTVGDDGVARLWRVYPDVASMLAEANKRLAHKLDSADVTTYALEEMAACRIEQ
jgi:WD40 repeat protein/energy-coupling factor transporter ATP-binding protein EcfA2